MAKEVNKNAVHEIINFYIKANEFCMKLNNTFLPHVNPEYVYDLCCKGSDLVYELNKSALCPRHLVRQVHFPDGFEYLVHPNPMPLCIWGKILDSIETTSDSWEKKLTESIPTEIRLWRQYDHKEWYRKTNAWKPGPGDSGTYYFLKCCNFSRNQKNQDIFQYQERSFSLINIY